MFAGVSGGVGERQHGGPVWPGTWLVGEEGPELLHLNSGTYGQVDNAQETQRAMSPTIVQANSRPLLVQVQLEDGTVLARKFVSMVSDYAADGGSVPWN